MIHFLILLTVVRQTLTTPNALFWRHIPITTFMVYVLHTSNEGLIKSASAGRCELRCQFAVTDSRGGKFTINSIQLTEFLLSSSWLTMVPPTFFVTAKKKRKVNHICHPTATIRSMFYFLINLVNTLRSGSGMKHRSIIRLTCAFLGCQPTRKLAVTILLKGDCAVTSLCPTIGGNVHSFPNESICCLRHQMVRVDEFTSASVFRSIYSTTNSEYKKKTWTFFFCTSVQEVDLSELSILMMI